MNPFGDPPHPAQRLEPVKEILLQELIYLVIVLKLSTALLKMLNPVETGILNLRRKTSLYLAAFNVSHERSGRPTLQMSSLREVGMPELRRVAAGLQDRGDGISEWRRAVATIQKLKGIMTPGSWNFALRCVVCGSCVCICTEFINRVSTDLPEARVRR